MSAHRLAVGIGAVVLVLAFCGVLLVFFAYRGSDESAGWDYINRGVDDTGAVNLVSAIYLNYRLYDTLFEILVFSVAVLGVRFYLTDQRASDVVEGVPESHVVRRSADLLFPLILIFALYLVVFGHLSPGGGFSGGVVAGSGLLLCSVALGAEVVARRFHERVLERLEWTALLAILLLALLPLLVGRPALYDLLPRGTPGRVASGGSVILYNLLIGFKVFVGTWVIIHFFIRHRGEI